MGEVLRFSDYAPRPAKPWPTEDATLIILPVIRIETYDDAVFEYAKRMESYDAGVERAGFGKPMPPGRLLRLMKEAGLDKGERS